MEDEKKKASDDNDGEMCFFTTWKSSRYVHIYYKIVIYV